MPVCNPAPPPKVKRLHAFVAAEDWDKARPLCAELLKRWPNDPNAQTLGARVALSGRRDAALCLERAEAALRLAPAWDEAHMVRILGLSALGERQRAAEAAEAWIAAAPTAAAAYYELTRADAARAAPHAPAMERLVAAAQRPDDKGMLLNALGLIDEKAGRRTALQRFFASKAALERPYDAGPPARYLKACRSYLTGERIAAAGASGLEARLVFIVGLPRTGSTLIERLLADHPAVEGLGEVMALPKILTAAGLGVAGDGPAEQRLGAGLERANLPRLAAAYLKAARPLSRDPSAEIWIDKLPANLNYCGLAAMMFPQARFVLTQRDPRDAMLSALRTYFTSGQSYSNDFSSFVAHWRLARSFGTLWAERLGDRLLTLPYEEVAADPAAASRRLVAHAGLAPADAALARRAPDAPVLTASAFQVREAVHTRSIGAWRAYEAEFAPLNALLGPFLRTAA